MEMLMCPAVGPVKDNKATTRKIELPKLRLLLFSLALLWFALLCFLFTSASRCFALLSSFLALLCFPFYSACSHFFPLLSFFLGFFSSWFWIGFIFCLLLFLFLTRLTQACSLRFPSVLGAVAVLSQWHGYLRIPLHGFLVFILCFVFLSVLLLFPLLFYFFLAFFSFTLFSFSWLFFLSLSLFECFTLPWYCTVWFWFFFAFLFFFLCFSTVFFFYCFIFLCFWGFLFCFVCLCCIVLLWMSLLCFAFFFFSLIFLLKNLKMSSMLIWMSLVCFAFFSPYFSLLHFSLCFPLFSSFSHFFFAFLSSH